MVDYDDLDGIFGGNEFETQLLADEGEKRRAVRISHRRSCGLEGDVVDSADAGAIEDRKVNAAEFCELLRELGHGGVGEDKAPVHNAWEVFARIGDGQFGALLGGSFGPPFATTSS